MRLPTTYTILALITTAVNIGTQDLVLRNYTGAFNISISILIGTSIGLIIKYIFDKRFIFHYKAENALHDSKIFMLYTLMGIITTILFWSFEFGFHHIFETKLMRYLGAIIGLSIGYITKYHLDKRFVFSGKLI